MSGSLMRAVWDLEEGVKPAEKLVLQRLAWFGDDKGRNCHPSIAELARSCVMWPRSVQGILARLRQMGWIEVQEEARQHRPTVYRVCLERFPGVQPGDVSGDAGEQDSDQQRGDVSDQPGVQPGDVSEAVENPVENPTEPPARGAAPRSQGCSGDHARGAAALHPISTYQEEPVRTERAVPLLGDASRKRTQPSDGFAVVERLAWDVVLAHPSDGEGDLVEHLKQACADHRIEYQGDVTHRAIRSVLFKVEKHVRQQQGKAASA